MSKELDNGGLTEQEIEENNRVDAVAIFAAVAIVVALAVFYVSR